MSQIFGSSSAQISPFVYNAQYTLLEFITELTCFTVYISLTITLRSIASSARPLAPWQSLSKYCVFCCPLSLHARCKSVGSVQFTQINIYIWEPFCCPPYEYRKSIPWCRCQPAVFRSIMQGSDSVSQSPSICYSSAITHNTQYHQCIHSDCSNSSNQSMAITKNSPHPIISILSLYSHSHITAFTALCRHSYYATTATAPPSVIPPRMFSLRSVASNWAEQPNAVEPTATSVVWDGCTVHLVVVI